MEKKLYYGSPKSLVRDWYAQLILFLAIIANLAMWIIIYQRVEPARDLIALHYTIYFGINFIGEWYKIFLIPFLGFFIGCVNALIGHFLYNKNKIGSYILITSALVIQLILLYSVHLITSYITT